MDEHHERRAERVADAAKKNGVDLEKLRGLDAEEYIAKVAEQLAAGKELNEWTAYGKDKAYFKKGVAIGEGEVAQRFSRRPVTEEEEKHKDRSFESGVYTAPAPARDGTPVASAKTTALKMVKSISDGIAKVKQARAATDKILADFSSKPIPIENVISILSNRFHARPVGARSRYRTYALDFATEDGQTFTLRLSDHSAHSTEFNKHGSNGDFNISVVVNHRGEDSMLRDKHHDVVLTQYTYAKEDFKNPAEVRKLIESVKGLFDNGRYVDLTGKAIVDTSGKLPLTQAELQKIDGDYSDAVRSNDEEAVRRLTEKVAVRNGYDIFHPVFHAGTLGTEDVVGKKSFVLSDNPEGFHVGTLKAATDRFEDVTAGVGDFDFSAKKDKNGKYYGVWGIGGEEGGRTAKTYDSTEEAMDEASLAMHDLLENKESAKRVIGTGGKMMLHELYLRKGLKLKPMADEKVSWVNAVKDAKREGYDGIVYTNDAEDKGSTSYVIWNKPDVKSADITYDDAGNLIPLSKRFNADNPDIRYSRVTDKSRIDDFEKARREGRTIKTIRSFVVVDGKLYSPMASQEKGADGKWHLGEPVGELKDGKLVGYLQKADERPDLAIWDEDTKSYKFKLKKEGKAVGEDGRPLIGKNGKQVKQSDITALYNPYWHSSNSALNDQFTSAYKRPNIVTVECEILKDEAVDGKRLDGGVRPDTDLYWADKANASIGRHDWHTGTVAKDLPESEKRSVYLTRELLPVRLMSTGETADKIISQLGGNLNKSGAYNAQVFPPQLARALEARGMKLRHGVDDDGIRYSRRDRDDNIRVDHKWVDGEQRYSRRPVTEEEEKHKGNGFESGAHPSLTQAPDRTPAASAKTIALETINSIADGVAKIKQAKSAMANFIVEFDRKPIAINDFVSRMANRLKAKPIGQPSRYRTYALDFATEDGQTFTLRLSDHSAHASAFVNNRSNGDFNISVVVNNRGDDTALRNKHDDVVLTQYTYAKEDFKNPADVRKLIESVKGLFDNGRYVDLTGKAIVDTSGKTPPTQAECRSWTECMKMPSVQTMKMRLCIKITQENILGDVVSHRVSA